MKINTTHLSYLEFMKNERKTLGFLRNNSFISNNFPVISANANIALYEYENDRRLPVLTFKFHADFDLIIEKQQRRIVIEALARPNFAEVSYVLSICENCTSPYALIRKFHFDYAIPIENDPVPKPVYHLQYGGTITPRLSAMEIDVCGIKEWLSSPRIFNIPMNLALFLDLVFCEFRSEITTGISERTEWRNFIKENEEIILKPYFENIRSFINNHHHSNFLFRDFNYGRPI